MTEWDRCRPWIEAALPYTDDTHTIEDVEAALGRNEMALFPLQRSAFVCEVINYPRLKDLHIFLAGGDLEELKSAEPLLHKAATALGCSRISIAGRLGWARAVGGWNRKWLVLIKTIAKSDNAPDWAVAALKYAGGTHSIKDLKALFLANQTTMISCGKSALICEVKNYPRKRALHVFLAGGLLGEIMSISDTLDSVAQLLDCSSISIAGRTGWGPTLKEFGYRPWGFCLSKDVIHV